MADSISQSLIEIILKVSGQKNALKSIKTFFKNVGDTVDKANEKFKTFGEMKSIKDMTSGLKTASRALKDNTKARKKDTESKKANAKATREQEKAEKARLAAAKKARAAFAKSVQRGVEVSDPDARKISQLNQQKADLGNAFSVGFVDVDTYKRRLQEINDEIEKQSPLYRAAQAIAKDLEEQEKERVKQVEKGVGLIDATAAAERKYQQEVEQINAAYKEGNATLKERDRAISNAGTRRDRAIMGAEERLDPGRAQARTRAENAERKRNEAIREGIRLTKTREDIIREEFQTKVKQLNLLQREGKFTRSQLLPTYKRIKEESLERLRAEKGLQTRAQRDESRQRGQELFSSTGNLGQRVAQKTAKATEDLTRNVGFLRREYIKANGSADGFEKRLRKVRKQIELNTFRTELYNSSNLRLAQTYSDVASRLSSFGRGAIVFGAALAGPAIIVSREFAKFEQATKNVVAVLGDFNTEVGRAAAFESLANTFINLGERTEFTADQIADAARQLGLAGFSLSEINNSLEDVVSLASAGNIELEEAAKIAVNIGRAFQIDPENFERISDVLATVATSSNTTVETLGESFKLLAPIASNLGQTLEETSAALGILGNAGVSASRAGTGLSRALSELLEKQDDFNLVLTQLGSSFDAIDPSKVALSEIIAEFERLQLSTEFSTANIFDLFDQRSARVVATLINQGSESLDRLTDSAENSAGAAERIREARIDSLFGDYLKATSAFRTTLIELGRTLAPIATTFVQSFTVITKFITSFVQENRALVTVIATVVTSFGGLIAAVGGASLAFSGLVRVLSGINLVKFLGELASATLFNTAALTAETTAIQANNKARLSRSGAIIASAGADAASGTAVNASTAVSGIRAFVAALNPAAVAIGAIVAGLALIATGVSLIVARETSRQLKELNRDFEKIGETLDLGAQSVSTFQKALESLERIPGGTELDVSNFLNFDISEENIEKTRAKLNQTLEESKDRLIKALDVSGRKVLGGKVSIEEGELVTTGFSNSSFFGVGPIGEQRSAISSLDSNLADLSLQFGTAEKQATTFNETIERLNRVRRGVFSQEALPDDATEEQRLNFIQKSRDAAQEQLELERQKLKAAQKEFDVLQNKVTENAEAQAELDKQLVTQEKIVKSSQQTVDLLARVVKTSGEELVLNTKINEVNERRFETIKNETLSLEEKTKILTEEAKLLVTLNKERSQELERIKELEAEEKKFFDAQKDAESQLQRLRDKAREREVDPEVLESEQLKRDLDLTAESIERQSAAVEELNEIRRGSIEARLKLIADIEAKEAESAEKSLEQANLIGKTTIEIAKLEQEIANTQEQSAKRKQLLIDLEIAQKKELTLLERDRQERLAEEAEEEAERARDKENSMETAILNAKLQNAEAIGDLQQQIELTKELRNLENRREADKLFEGDPQKKAVFLKEKQIALENEIKDIQEKAQKEKEKEQKKENEAAKRRLDLQKAIRDALVAQVKSVEDAARVQAFLGRIEAQRLAARRRFENELTAFATRRRNPNSESFARQTQRDEARLAILRARSGEFGIDTSFLNNVQRPVAQPGAPGQAGVVNNKTVNIEEGAIQIDAQGLDATELVETIQNTLFDLINNAAGN